MARTHKFDGAYRHCGDRIVGIVRTTDAAARMHDVCDCSVRRKQRTQDSKLKIAPASRSNILRASARIPATQSNE